MKCSSFITNSFTEIWTSDNINFDSFSYCIADYLVIVFSFSYCIEVSLANLM